MKNLILYTALFFAFTNAQAQRLISIDHNGVSSFYTNFDTALAQAQNGDKVYLSGGYFSAASGIIRISKSISLIGVGYNADSNSATGNTILVNYIDILPSASGGMITGILESNAINFHDTVTNFIINRCYINNSILIGSGAVATPASNISIIETVVGNSIYANTSPTTYPTNISIINSFIGYGIAGNQIIYSGSSSNIWQGLVCKNSVLIGLSYCPYYCSYLFNNIQFSTFENCIIIDYGGGSSPSYYGGAYNTFRNCLFNQNISYFTPTNNSIFNCIFNQNKDSIFINRQANAVFNIHDNYQLKANSPGKNSGTDGNDIGIYGGAFPFKDGAIPFNPHIQIKTINGKTNSNGVLPVQIKVKAQDN